VVDVTEPSNDPTVRFFEELAQRGDEPLLRKLRGVVRFDIVDGERVERKYVTVDRGQISVSGRGTATQTVVRMDREPFGLMTQGELNPVAAVLRGELAVEGDWRLLVLIQRLFSGASPKKPSHRGAGYAKRR
jgi:putative sterol carrier protein